MWVGTGINFIWEGINYIENSIYLIVIIVHANDTFGSATYVVSIIKREERHKALWMVPVL